ncbi:Trihelix transcription factor ptl [Thalictrum thalictroides]|uniref:Trihelix transcription factor ptl n=1 Tax=Thalictrum thalictroides TaxID=46969 RepID=A0A7J6VL75_THATH|nr:Trihelix transcription factor ptl [Thalictrum thalictroides]
MEMNDHQYGLPDLRHLLTGRTHFSTFPQQFQTHRNLANTQHYDFSMLSSTTSSQVVVHDPHHVNFSADSTTTTNTTTTNNHSTSPTNNNTITTTTPPLTTTTTTATNTNSLCGFENMEGCFGADGGNGRWPRQETLTLLEIRSRLDSKFKEANQKGPLWDEISRIMAEEHGYQRTGKKCREKFENLYKYYKKTKEGKAGRQDGKHYRFFRQLEALYGDTSNPVSVSETSFIGNNLRFQNTSNTTTHVNHEGLQGHKLMSESLSISNSSFFDTSSSEDGDNDGTAMAFMENYSSMDKKNKMVMKDIQNSKRGRKTWKTKIRDFVDSHMKKLMETQEVWLEKMLKTLEQKEKERMLREEEWRKREAARIDQEHKFWANERAWFEARDSALMEALRKITGKELKASSFKELMGGDHPENNGSETLESTVNSTDKWPESDISSLIHLRTSLESSFQQNEYSKETLWEEISAKMACLGYDRSAKSCEEKWEDITNYIRSSKECSKKHNDNCFQHLESNYNQNQGGVFYGHGHEAIGIHSISTDGPHCNTNVGTTVSDSSFRFLMAEGENLWDNYGVNITRGENH